MDTGGPSVEAAHLLFYQGSMVGVPEGVALLKVGSGEVKTPGDLNKPEEQQSSWPRRGHQRL